MKPDQRDLHLNVKQCFFDQYKAGDKDYEYRLYNEYWRKRLEGRNYHLLYYKAGYPKRNDHTKIEILPYRGYKIITRQHPHFGPDPVKVFAIRLRG
jgi:hypothetical protein